MTIRIAACLSLLLAMPARAEPKRERDPFLREDWIVSGEPTHPDYWGLQWSYTNMVLPYRVMQRGKHVLETRYANNWRYGSENGGVPGIATRLVVGFFLDFGMMMGNVNIHHAAGHDAAAREFDRGFGDGRSVSRRFKQVLPNFAGGRSLRTDERQPQGRGADANTRAMVLPMEAENYFAYEEGKKVAGGEVNVTSAERYLFYRGRFLMDLTELGTLNQAFIDGQQPGAPPPRVECSGCSTDFTWYLHYLNRDRYAVTRVDDYKLKMNDIKTAFYVQALDPMMWSALYAVSRDYIVGARDTTRLPMLPLGRDIDYLPSLRVFFSPFGIDYFQDNYFRRRGVLVNGYWTMGDNRYEKRYGGGVDIEGLRLGDLATFGCYAQLHQQPLLSRVVNQTPLTADEAGRTHLAYNVGGSVNVPVWTFDKGDDPRRLFLYARGGVKNLSWFPGAYLPSGAYVQTGLGVRL